VHLLGVAEARRHEQAPIREPVEEGRAARLLIAREARRERGVGRGDAVEDQVATLTVLRDGRLRDERAGAVSGCASALAAERSVNAA